MRFWKRTLSFSGNDAEESLLFERDFQPHAMNFDRSRSRGRVAHLENRIGFDVFFWSSLGRMNMQQGFTGTAQVAGPRGSP